MLKRDLVTKPPSVPKRAAATAKKEGELANTHDTGFARHVLPESDDAISQALVSARANALPLDGFPGAIPETMTQAYDIQSASIARWPDSVGGWKVGLIPPPLQDRYSAERLAGPIFQSDIFDVSPGSIVTMPVFVGGFAAIEAEFIVRLGESIEPVERQWSDEDLVAKVAAIHIGAEIASSPMAEINNLGPTVIASDFGNNAGLLLGPEIANWQSARLEDLPAKVHVDGEIVGEASAAAIPGGPIGALRSLVQVAAQRGIELPAGTLISTGASTGIHDVEASSISRVEFGEHGWFEVTFEPMPARQ